MSERIKILTNMLFENIELLSIHDSKTRAYEDRRIEWLIKNPESQAWEFRENPPIAHTSKENIRNIVKILRNELLKIVEENK